MRPTARSNSGFVQSEGKRLHYLAYGAGNPTLLVLPGISSPAMTWEFVALELASELRVLIVDNRGRGLSDAPLSGYALDDYVADTLGLIEATRLERPVLLGHSMGARIAAALGALHPDAVGPMIIVDPPLCGPSRGDYPIPLSDYLRQLHEARAGTTVEAIQRAYPSLSDREARIRAEWLPTCAEHAIVESWHHFSDEDFFVHWRQLCGPLLFVYGERSPVVTREGLTDVAAANRNARIACIRGAGHTIPWDNLDDFVAVVRNFTRP